MKTVQVKVLENRNRIGSKGQVRPVPRALAEKWAEAKLVEIIKETKTKSK